MTNFKKICRRSTTGLHCISMFSIQTNFRILNQLLCQVNILLYRPTTSEIERLTTVETLC